MPDRTRTRPTVGEFRPCDYCQGEYKVTKPGKCFCSAKCRAAAHREKQLEGVPARVTGGPRRTTRGYSYTVHLDSAAFDLGDEVRIKQAPED